MSRAEKIKEQIGFIKFWLGIFVATILAIIGWIFVNFETAPYWQLILASISVIPIVVALFLAIRKFNKKLDEIEKE